MATRINQAPSHRWDRWLVRRLFQAIGPAPIRIALGGGDGFVPAGVSPVATVRVRDRRTLAQLVLDPEIGFGEAYAEGRIQVEGDFVRFLEVVYSSIGNTRKPLWYSGVVSQWMDWWQNNTPRGSLANIHRHYDLGNDFYKLWLDREMIYTCAYFPSSSATLEEAQTAKMDHVCRKLQLQPGETVVEAGCGWGALAMHMARHYGVLVKAFNISKEQIFYARRRAVEIGISDRVEFIEDDYRNVSGKFDAFVSVGMLEHVGLSHYRELGNVIHRTIGDSGRGLLHFIGRNYHEEFSRWIRKRIFPGAYAPALGEAMRVLEPWDYSVLDVENLRPHYAKTLEHWLDRFERCSHQVATLYGDWFQRAWRLYLAGSIAAFRTGRLQLFQVLFAGSQCREFPWTRAHLYTDAQSVESRPRWTHAMS